ncbi:Manganese transporter pdt1 [Leucoagaricus sp. SymC.cos]|nr:Manganese transporter pdt1 [Leucoagaricus sp. SymC.cos]
MRTVLSFRLTRSARWFGFVGLRILLNALPKLLILPSPMPAHINGSPPASQPPQQSQTSWFRTAGVTLFRHIRHTGVGVVCAVAYFDPGNWGVDLQAGSLYGYRLLFVVLLAGLFAVFLQVLASRLGCVTGLDLASHTRLLLNNRSKHPRLVRWLALYPIYALSEIVIIATDLAELLGSAIALCMLFPELQLWHGVLLTAADVLLILAMGDPLRGRPVRMFEFLIAAMVLAVLICMAIIISEVDVNWGDAFQGYLPSRYIFASGSLYTSIGIIGATIMPHSLFLGSALATQDRVACRPVKDDKLVLNATSTMVSEDSTMISTSPHIYHGIADVVVCLLGFAVLINSLILILASAVFYYGKHNLGNADPASLFDAYDLIRDLVGKPAATLFAIALLASGQSSSFIATVAGQAVSEGFIQWRVSPVIRRLLTRLIAIVPSMAVAIAVGREGIDALLVVSQVILSIVLPFITFPLLYCTSSKAIMRAGRLEGGDVENGNQWVDYSNGKVMIAIGVVIWLIIVVANAYVLVSLAMGTA